MSIRRTTAKKPPPTTSPTTMTATAPASTSSARVIDKGMPLFCICRGFQELNVVLGGTLETELQRGANRLDHRARQTEDLDMQLRPGPRDRHHAGRRPGAHPRQGPHHGEHRPPAGHQEARPGARTWKRRPPTASSRPYRSRAPRRSRSEPSGTPNTRRRTNADSVKLFGAFGDAARRYRAERQAGPVRKAAAG